MGIGDSVHRSICFRKVLHVVLASCRKEIGRVVAVIIEHHVNAIGSIGVSKILTLTRWIGVPHAAVRQKRVPRLCRRRDCSVNFVVPIDILRRLIAIDALRWNGCVCLV